MSVASIIMTLMKSHSPLAPPPLIIILINKLNAMQAISKKIQPIKKSVDVKKYLTVTIILTSTAVSSYHH